MLNVWKSGIMGLVIADALGVPVEFTSREERKNDPVRDMRSYGTHNQPMGTWSDDSSMTLATFDSIRECGEINPSDIMDRFSRWYQYGEYTPFGDVFDIGITTSRALMNYARGVEPTQCGGRTEMENGNGSLMRILPICLYLYEKYDSKCAQGQTSPEVINQIHEASALTHGHLRSQMACGIYYFCVKNLISPEGKIKDRLQRAMNEAFEYYKDCAEELRQYDILRDLDILHDTDESKIRSTGYVVHTLIAAVWCLLTTKDYEECVLKAVNLGDDTDTVAAVTGGLAGLYYDYYTIPPKWIVKLQKREWIEKMTEGMIK